MTHQLRCKSTLHGILSDDRKKLEVKCKRRKCGAAPGVVVLHTIDLETLDVTTRRFHEPSATPERKSTP